MPEIINKVAESGLITLDLADFSPQTECVEIDMKDQLWQELVLREKDFREYVKTHKWNQYEGKALAIHCSVDAVVPNWAYMLLASSLLPYAKSIFFGSKAQVLDFLWKESLQNSINQEEYSDARILVKGCADKPIPSSAYLEITSLLQPVVKSLMFGEACSAVPVFKSRK